MMLTDLKFRLRALLRRGAMDRELDEELQFHLERAIEKHVRAGLSPAAARRRARLEFGGVEQIREDTRSVRGVTHVESLLQDLRYAWRGVRARPGFAAAIVLTLGLGIGANTAMFGVVDRLLVRPPAYLKSPDQVQRVYWSFTWDGGVNTERSFQYLRYQHVREHTHSFDAVAAFAYRRAAVGAGAEARELEIAAVSASFFDFFAAPPALGRYPSADEDRAPAGENVAVLGHAYWQSAYGGRADVIGEQLRVGEGTYTVIGVAPAAFVGVTNGRAPALFVPITTVAYARMRNYAENFNWSWLQILVRRAPGVSVAAAEADLTRAFERSWDAERELAPRIPTVAEARPHATLAPVHPARGPDAGPEARVAAWVMGVAFVVLLIACANVMNLLLVRAVSRRREIGLRLALGVSRRRLVQQLLSEALLLAVMGGVVGLALAKWGGATLRTLFLRADYADAVATDTRTLLFTGLLTLAVALLAGVAPALQALRADVAGVIKAGMGSGAYRASPLRTALLLLQGALCVVLLVGAGLFVRSLLNVRAYPLGYDTESVVLANGNRRGTPLTPAEANALADRLLRAASSVQGVQSATLTTSVPFYSFEGRGAPRVPGRDSLNLLGSYTLQAGSSRYFETIGTRILRGRGITDADLAGAQPVVIVSEAMAAAIWPGEDAIGRQLRLGPDTLPMLTVVGVAENVSGERIGGAPEFWYYLPIEQYKQMFGTASPSLFVRVRGRAEDHVEAIRARLQQEMPGESYVTAMPLGELIARQQRSWQLGATMFAVFAGLALVLASIGLYSVIAYAVAQRTRELGVRIALGASVPRVVRMVIGQGVLFALIALAAGGAAALVAARWVEPLLFSASPRDPLVFTVVAATLVLVALAATAIPAWRATRVDPTIALRAE